MRIEKDQNDFIDVAGRRFNLNEYNIFTAAAEAAKFTTLNKENGDDYQTVNDFHLLGFIVYKNSTTASVESFSFGYGDDAVSNSAGAPANMVYLNDGLGGMGILPSGTEKLEFLQAGIVVPAGKYPCIQGGAAGNAVRVVMIGKEVA